MTVNYSRVFILGELSGFRHCRLRGREVGMGGGRGRGSWRKGREGRKGSYSVKKGKFGGIEKVKCS